MKPLKMLAIVADPVARKLAIVIFLGVVASVSVSSWVYRQAADNQRSVFLETAQKHHEILALNVSHTLEAVESVAALFSTYGHVEKDKFDRFADFELSDRASIRALVWAPRIGMSERRDFERRAENEGFADFRITERGRDGQFIEAGTRNEYFPSFYRAPGAGHEAALGFDLASEPTRLAALVEARDSGEMSATGRISLLQGHSPAYGTLVFHPVYQNGLTPETMEARREKLVGFSLGIIDLGKFLGSEDPGGSEFSGIKTFVFDRNAPPGEQILYPKASIHQNPSELAAGTCAYTDLHVAGRMWDVVQCPRTIEINAAPAIILLVIGLVGTVFLSILVRIFSLHKTARRTFDDALRISEARFRHVIDHTSIMMQSVDIQTGFFLSCNSGWLRKLGFTSEEVPGLKLASRIHPDDLNHCMELLNKAVSSGQHVELATRFLTKNGDAVHVEGNIIVLPGESGNLITTGIFIDVTERVEAEAVLRESEAKFSGILDIANDAIISVNEKNRIILFNKGAEAIFGYTPEDMIGKTIECLLPARFRAGHGHHIEKFQASSEHSKEMRNGRELRALRANGEEFSVQASVSKLLTSNGFISTVILRDTTEEQAIAEENLRIAEDLTTLIDTANAPIFGVDKDSCVNEWNQKAAEITGFTKNQAIGQKLIQRFIAEDHKGLVKDVVDLALKGQATENFEFSLYTKDRDRVDILLNATPRRDAQGNIVGVIGVGQDITEVKRGRVAAERLATLVKNSTEFIAVTDLDGRLLYLNKAGLELAGLGGEEVITEKHFYHFLGDDDRKIFFEEIFPVVESTGFWMGEFRLRKFDDDKSVSIEANVFEIRNPDTDQRTGYGIVIRDVTEQKLNQAQLVQAAKMSTLGEMSTGMAHELNQPLNVIKMAADNALDAMEDGDDDPGYIAGKLKRISGQIDRAAGIIDHMRMFGRKAEGKGKPFDPAQAARRALEFVEAQLRIQEVTVEIDFSGEPLLVIGQDIQFEQVILNLITNARQAMEGAAAPTDRGHVLGLSLHRDAGGNAVISVSDTGGGIPENIKDRVFEPFFTTKDVGDGTGLGLSISYGIIGEMGGKISVENARNGAVFTLSMPTVPDVAPASVSPPEPGEDA